MPLSVLALCRYSELGASSRQRFVLYRDALKHAGIDVTVAEFFDDAYLLARFRGDPIWRAAARAYARRARSLLALHRYDLLWIEKEMLPFVPAWLECSLYRRIPYVIDIDDAWFFKYRNHHSPFVRGFLGAKFERLVQGAALTLVGNTYLGSWAAANGARDVHLLPTVVDLQRYKLRPPSDGPFTIGWIGTPMTVRYLEHIAGPLRQICDGRTARLRIIGDMTFQLSGVASQSDAWRGSTEAELISQCDIGIMPLPDDPWVHGKCGYKLVQFLAAGRTAVATPTDANRAILDDGHTGLLAASDAEWVSALVRLRDDPRLREQMGAAGRTRVEQNYSLAATVDGLAHSLTVAAEGKSRPLAAPAGR